MTTNVDLEKLQKDAVDIFNQGFACSESVIYASVVHSPEQRCVSDISSDVRHLVILRLTAVSSFRTKSTISSRNTVVQHAAVF